MKFVERMRGTLIQSEIETDVAPENFIKREKIVIEKNGARVEFPQGTTPEFIAEILKHM